MARYALVTRLRSDLAGEWELNLLIEKPEPALTPVGRWGSLSEIKKMFIGDVMNVEQIIINPITTPNYPDPTEVRRFIDDPDRFYGYDYVFLEDATWNALCEIARERGCTVDELCGDIDLNFAPDESFAPSARRYVLRYIDQVPENIELPANFRALKELRDRRRAQ